MSQFAGDPVRDRQRERVEDVQNPVEDETERDAEDGESEDEESDVEE